MAKAPDLVGQRFGRLVVQSRHPQNSLAGSSRWNCLCDCGGTTIAQGGHLRIGHTVSCGCAFKEAITTHGGRETPEYRVWANLVQRCSNPKDPGYPDYGARGISVCVRWYNSFENFLADMGPRPSDSHSIERDDVNGNYEPGNCRWATPIEQANNKRNNVIHEYKGVQYTEAALARSAGMSQATLRARLAKGMSLEEAVETKVGNQGRRS